jgi:hypothetical protein
MPHESVFLEDTAADSACQPLLIPWGSLQLPDALSTPLSAVLFSKHVRGEGHLNHAQRFPTDQSGTKATAPQ